MLGFHAEQGGQAKSCSALQAVRPSLGDTSLQWAKAGCRGVLVALWGLSFPPKEKGLASSEMTKQDPSASLQEVSEKNWGLQVGSGWTTPAPQLGQAAGGQNDSSHSFRSKPMMPICGHHCSNCSERTAPSWHIETGLLIPMALRGPGK